MSTPARRYEEEFHGMVVGGLLELGEGYLRLGEKISEAQSAHVGVLLKAFGKNWQFWFADWWREHTSRFGRETASQVLDAIDYEWGTIKNILSVAERVPRELVTPALPHFSYYQAVAPLEPHLQRELLKKALPRKGEEHPALSRAEFREEVNLVKAAVVASEWEKSIEQLKEEPKVYEEMRCKCCGALERHWGLDP